MDAKSYKNLMDSIKLGQNAVKQFESQVSNMEDIFSGTIEGLGGEDKQKVQTLQAMVNRALTKAKKGEDYNTVIDNIKETFKKDLSNGSNSNG